MAASSVAQLLERASSEHANQRDKSKLLVAGFPAEIVVLRRKEVTSDDGAIIHDVQVGRSQHNKFVQRLAI